MVCMWCLVFLFFVVSTSAIDCLKRLVSKMTYYVSSGMLGPTHSLAYQIMGLNCVMTEVHGCKQLAKGCYAAVLYRQWKPQSLIVNHTTLAL